MFVANSRSILKNSHIVQFTPVAYFTREVNPSLAKPPSNFDGGLAKLGLTSLVD